MTRLRRLHRWWRRRMDDPRAALLIFLGVGFLVAAWNPYLGGGLLLGGGLVPRSLSAPRRRP